MGLALDPGAALYVATDLDTIESSLPHVLADDVVISGRAYRRLDPPYYAWLRHRMTLARQANDAGRLTSASFDRLRQRFNDVNTWALEHLGADALLDAVRSLNPRSYEGPRVDDDDDGLGGVAVRMTPARPPTGGGARSTLSSPTYPDRRTAQFTEAVSDVAVRQVDVLTLEHARGAITTFRSPAAVHPSRRRLCAGVA